MRCALDIDFEKSFMDQEIKAWGELQKLEEEPCYKESEIRDESSKLFFRAVKYAYDEVGIIMDSMEFDGIISENQKKDFMLRLNGDLCVILYSILDEEA